MDITEQDTFDTLKHGYIPKRLLFEYMANESKMDVKEFTELFDNHQYGDHSSYHKCFYLLWDQDVSYTIEFLIDEPSINNDDIETTEVTFVCTLNISDEEQRCFPPLRDIQETYKITSRAKFKEVMFLWKEFVGKAYVEIFRNRLEILEDLDRIVNAEYELTDYHRQNTKEHLKQDYIHWLSMLPLKMARVTEQLVNFEGNGETL